MPPDKPFHVRFRPKASRIWLRFGDYETWHRAYTAMYALIGRMKHPAAYLFRIEEDGAFGEHP